MTKEQQKQKEFIEMIKEMFRESGVKFLLAFKFPDEKDETCVHGLMTDANVNEMLKFVEMIEESVESKFNNMNMEEN